MAGVLGIYGLIVAVILQGSISKPEEANGASRLFSFSGYAYLSAGLCCGLSGLAAAWRSRSSATLARRSASRRPFVGMILILIFAALGRAASSSPFIPRSRPVRAYKLSAPC